jgi:AcrR family transcriptional regulator
MCARIVNKEEKKEQILRAAIRLFARKGFARATISDIAVAAGTGKGTIYEYFETKDEIIQGSFSFFIKELEFDFEHILLSPLPAIDKLKQVFSAFSQTMELAENRQLMELMFDFWAESIKSVQAKNFLFKEMSTFYQAYRKLCEDLILDGIHEGSLRKDLDAPTMATIILGMNDGIMVQWLLDKSIDFSRTMNEMIRMLLEGISIK